MAHRGRPLDPRISRGHRAGSQSPDLSLHRCRLTYRALRVQMRRRVDDPRAGPQRWCGRPPYPSMPRGHRQSLLSRANANIIILVNLLTSRWCDVFLCLVRLSPHEGGEMNGDDNGDNRGSDVSCIGTGVITQATNTLEPTSGYADRHSCARPIRFVPTVFTPPRLPRYLLCERPHSQRRLRY